MFFDNKNQNVVDKTTQLNQFLYYNEEFRILICSICYTCVTKNGFKNHLNLSTHINLTSNEKEQLYQQINQYVIVNFVNLKHSLNYQHCFSFLSIHQTALNCKLCSSYTVLSNKTIKVHLNTQHNIKNVSKVDQDNEKYVIKNLCAQAFSNNAYKYYFLISYQEKNQISTTFNQQIATTYSKEELQKIERFQNKSSKINANQSTLNTLSFKEYDSFNQDFYFHEYIQDKNFDDLIESIDLAVIKQNDHLKLIVNIATIYASKYVSFVSKVDQRSKQIIQSDSLKAKKEDKDLKPFKELQNSNTTHEYYKTFANCITYIYCMTKIKVQNYQQSNFQLYSNEINALQSDILYYFDNQNENNEE